MRVGGNQSWPKRRGIRRTLPSVRQPKPEARTDGKAEEAPKITPNWVQVKDLYQRDQIVDLKVSGCNRGGLLVEGENLYGFVPFSHLGGYGGTGRCI